MESSSPAVACRSPGSRQSVTEVALVSVGRASCVGRHRHRQHRRRVRRATGGRTPPRTRAPSHRPHRRWEGGRLRTAPKRISANDARLGLGDTAQVMTGDFTEEAGPSRRATAPRPGLPTAIFTANDVSAVGAIDEIERCGLVVPDDVAVVGFDNTSLAASEPHRAHHDRPTTARRWARRRQEC